MRQLTGLEPPNPSLLDQIVVWIIRKAAQYLELRIGRKIYLVVGMTKAEMDFLTILQTGVPNQLDGQPPVTH